MILAEGNSSAMSINLGKLRTVRRYQCLKFVRLGLRAMDPLCEKVKTGEDEVLMNPYY